MKTITVERIISAPLEKVWAVAGNFLKSPGPSISVVVEKEGDLNSNGIGAEREITVRNSRVYERLESIDPPNSFTYTILYGAPLKNYLGKVEFKSNGNSTVVKWSSTFTPKIPGTAWIVGRVTRKIINQFIDELENIK